MGGSSVLPPARFKPSKQTELNRANTIGTTMTQSHAMHSNMQLAADIDAGDGLWASRTCKSE